MPKSSKGLALRYTVAVLSVVLATALRFPIQPILGDSAPFLLCFPAVLVASWFGGLGPGLAATVLGALATGFLWMQPSPGFAPFALHNTLQLAIFMAVSAFMSWLVDLLHVSVDSLNAAHRRMEQVLSSMSDGFIIFDRNWRYTYVNDSGARIAQLPADKLLGNVVWDLFPDEVGQRGHQELTRAMCDQVPVHFEYFYPRFARWFEFKAYPAQEGLALYVADITEKKHLQEAVTRELEIRVQQKTAELEGKNQSLEALTYSLAHDLRAPMRSISGFVSLLLEEHGDKLGPDGIQLATRALNSSKHAEKLMVNLLEYGRLAHVDLPLGPVDSQSVAENILRDLAQEIHNHGGRVKIIGRLPMVMANPTVLEQALTNLIMNALKYTNDGESPMVAVRSQEQGDMARIVVEDYGVGIAPEHLEKLFKPFERLSGKKPGTGLGLSIVAKGIQRMGGRVGVESTPGKGSRFWFELPRA